MAQTIQTPEQQKYLTRLMGYDFIIQYCFGRSNVITNALSCTFDHSKGMVLTLLMPHFFFIDELKGELADNPEFNALRQDLQENPTNRPTLTYSDGLVLQNGRIWLPNKLNFIRLLLHKFHSTPIGSHMGVTKALARLQDNFTWNSIRQDVHDFVAQCLNCRYTKYVTRKPAGLYLHYLFLLSHRRTYHSIFIVELPIYKGNTTILVVVYRFSKGIHLGLLPSQYIAYQVATLFLDILAKLHGMPQSLVSDRDPLFISKFWQELFKLSGTKLRLSLACHPQSDGQTEVMNRIIEQFLRAFVHHRPSSWGKFLPWVEWSYNTSRNTSTDTSPFEVTYNKKPPTILQYIIGSS